MPPKLSNATDARAAESEISQSTRLVRLQQLRDFFDEVDPSKTDEELCSLVDSNLLGMSVLWQQLFEQYPQASQGTERIRVAEHGLLGSSTIAVDTALLQPRYLFDKYNFEGHPDEGEKDREGETDRDSNSLFRLPSGRQDSFTFVLPTSSPVTAGSSLGFVNPERTQSLNMWLFVGVNLSPDDVVNVTGADQLLLGQSFLADLCDATSIACERSRVDSCFVSDVPRCVQIVFSFRLTTMEIRANLLDKKIVIPLQEFTPPMPLSGGRGSPIASANHVRRALKQIFHANVSQVRYVRAERILLEVVA